MRLQWYDANISLPGCDKNMPGTVMAMARLNRPALMVYGGTIRPGTASASGQPIDIISAFQSYGGRAAAVLATPIISDDDQGLHAVCVHFPMPLI
jgi:dihydroxy-acid dehydratase